MDVGTPTKQKLGCKTGSRHLGIILGKIEIDEVVEDKCWGWRAVWSQDAELYRELPILTYRSSQAHLNSVQCHGYLNLRVKQFIQQLLAKMLKGECKMVKTYF
jgi:hypothetical protein